MDQCLGFREVSDLTRCPLRSLLYIYFIITTNICTQNIFSQYNYIVQAVQFQHILLANSVFPFWNPSSGVLIIILLFYYYFSFNAYNCEMLFRRQFYANLHTHTQVPMAFSVSRKYAFLIIQLTQYF